jgi:hypothetical protein
MIGKDEPPVTNSLVASEPAGMVDLGGFANSKIMMIGTNIFLLVNPNAPSLTPAVNDKDTISSLRIKPQTRSATAMGWNINSRQTDVAFEAALKAVPTKESPEQLLIAQQNAEIEAVREEESLRKTIDTTANMLETIALRMAQIIATSTLPN